VVDDPRLENRCAGRPIAGPTEKQFECPGVVHGDKQLGPPPGDSENVFVEAVERQSFHLRHPSHPETVKSPDEKGARRPPKQVRRMILTKFVSARTSLRRRRLYATPRDLSDRSGN
jgi:hypothetical protein